MTFDEAYDTAHAALTAAKAAKQATEYHGVRITKGGRLYEVSNSQPLTLGAAIGVAAYSLRHS